MIDVAKQRPYGTRQARMPLRNLTEQLRVDAVGSRAELGGSVLARLRSKPRELIFGVKSLLFEGFVAQHQHREFIDAWLLGDDVRRVFARANTALDLAFAFEFREFAELGNRSAHGKIVELLPAPIHPNFAARPVSSGG